jgi:hypothetical protein
MCVLLYVCPLYIRTRNAELVRDECVCVCVCVCILCVCPPYIYVLGVLSSYADVC